MRLRAAHQWCPVAQRWPRRPAAGWSQSAKRLLWPRATASAEARMITSSRLMSPSSSAAEQCTTVLGLGLGLVLALGLGLGLVLALGLGLGEKGLGFWYLAATVVTVQRGLARHSLQQNSHTQGTRNWQLPLILESMASTGRDGSRGGPPALCSLVFRSGWPGRTKRPPMKCGLGSLMPGQEHMSASAQGLTGDTRSVTHRAQRQGGSTCDYGEACCEPVHGQVWEQRQATIQLHFRWSRQSGYRFAPLRSSRSGEPRSASPAGCLRKCFEK